MDHSTKCTFNLLNGFVFTSEFVKKKLLWMIIIKDFLRVLHHMYF